MCILHTHDYVVSPKKLYFYLLHKITKKKMNRPNFEPIFSKKSEFCEKSSSKPISAFIPHQALSLKELVTRFEKGQRLNVHHNFAAGANLENITDEEALNRIRSESMDSDDFPPSDVHDVCDVERLYLENIAHKSEFKSRMNKKIKEAKQAKQQQAQQAPPTPSPSPEPAS